MIGFLITPAALGQPASVGSLATPGFHHLHLRSMDPDAAITFYRRQFPSTSSTVVAGFPALRTGDGFLLFTRVPEQPSSQTQSAYWHFGWHVRDAREDWQRFTQSGAPLLPLFTDEGTQVTFAGEWWPGTLTKAEAAARRAAGDRAASPVGWGYLQGPEGVKVEFQGNMPAERFNHVHMYQEAVFCAEIWYRRHLNAPILTGGRRPVPPRSEGDCTATLGEPSWLSLDRHGTIRTPAGGVRFGDVTVNWYQRQQSTPLVSSRGQTIDHLGLAVTDLSAWHAKLTSERVTVLEGPYAFGDGRAILIEGPSREAIELIEVAPRNPQ